MLLVLLPLGALLRFVDVLLLSRDGTLSENALRALELGSRIRSQNLERHRFRFGTDPAECRAAAAPFFGQTETRPFLTLRSPLQVGERRRMNLFEPRCRHMRRREGCRRPTTEDTGT